MNIKLFILLLATTSSLLFLQGCYKITKGTNSSDLLSFSIESLRSIQSKKILFYSNQLSDSIKNIFNNASTLYNLNLSKIAIYQDSILLLNGTDISIPIKRINEVELSRKLNSSKEISTMQQMLIYLGKGPVSCQSLTKVSNPPISISIYVPNTLPTVWQDAITAAIAKWNAINNKIYFHINNTINKGIPAAYLQIHSYYDNTTSVIAYAELASAPNPGSYIYINTNYNYLTSDYMLHTIMHEMGHTIGYLHTDSSEGSTIPGTPTSDSYSIMNSIVNGLVDFSTWDTYAQNQMYPPVTLPSPGCSF